jgi:alkaline phosphatase
MKSLITYLTLFLLLQLSCQPISKKTETRHPKNIILLIGDGMGVTQLYAGHIANKGTLNIERCKHIGFSRTHSANNLITDSGAGGTAIACGIKTNNNLIGMTPDSVPIKSILHYAEMNNKVTGLVATSEITHATPASFIAHSPSRYEYENIAADFLKTDIDVFIGGGLDHFTKKKDNIKLIDQLKAKGYTIAKSMKELANCNQGKLAALVYKKHPPYIASGRGNFLEISSKKAIDLLSQNENGFFLMIEGSQIDWAGHDNDSEKLVQEMLDFDKAVGIALNFAEKNKETLVIITADHETGGYVISGGDINTGKVEGIFSTNHHSAVMVPVITYGPQAENFMGFMENIDIFTKMYDSFGFEK